MAKLKTLIAINCLLEKKAYFSTPCVYPKLDEQRKIRSLFSNLDHLITLHQRELSKLQNMKKALLEKVFV